MSQVDGVCVVVPFDQKGFRPIVYGMGILVSNREILTCAHVIDAALGKEWHKWETPAKVRFCFPLVDGYPCAEGTVDRKRWFPPSRLGHSEPSDIAVIELDDNAPPAAGRAIIRKHVLGASVSVYGFCGKEVKGAWQSHPYGQWVEGKVVGLQPGQRVQFDGLRTTGARVQRGFSGGGVYDSDQRAIVGMIVETETDRETKVSQFISALSLNLALGRPTLSIQTQALRNSLPRDTQIFTARDYELKLLLDAISRPQVAKHGATVFAIDGMAGVGKTALAVHAGHLLAEHFPDGQLFISLHGHRSGHSPVPPSEALASLLSAVGVPTDTIPVDPVGLNTQAVTDSRSLMWRDLSSKMKILLILDDAASHDQVEPLMPGGNDSLVLVTSRRRLAALAALPLPLSTLSTDQAVELFCRVSKRTPEADDRLSLVQLVELCGGLPLAISLLGGRLRHHPMWTFPGLVERLKSSQDRLSEIRAEDLQASAAFELSYVNLTEEDQLFFKMLALHPGSDLEAHAAAALTSISVNEADQRLEVLYGDNLLDQPTADHYRMHDLVREYGRNLAATLPEIDRDKALRRLFGYYETTAEAAAAHVGRRMTPYIKPIEDSVGEVATRPLALAWMVRERGNNLACIEYEQRHGYYAQVIRIASIMASFMRQIGPWDEAIQLQHKAISAAQRLRDPAAEAKSLCELGVLFRRIGDLDGSRNALARALSTCRRLDDRDSVANCLNELGVTQRALGDLARAKIKHEEALLIFRELGNDLGQGRSLNYLGVDEMLLGNYIAANDSLELALDLFREGGDRHGEASVLNELGMSRRRTGDQHGALECQTRALQIFRDLGDRHGQANALSALGTTYEMIGDFEQAQTKQRDALEIFESYGNDLGKSEVHNRLGSLLRDSGDFIRGRAEHEIALKLAERVGSRLEQARALAGVGRCSLELGDQRTAISRIEHAMEIYDRIGTSDAMELRAELSGIRTALN